MSNSRISDNQSSVGGGILSEGTLTVSNSTINDNASYGSGGGIRNSGTATISTSTISGNSAGSSGGGIRNSATLTLNNSTVSGNSAINGGGIFNSSGNSTPGITTMTLNNSTISGNSASSSGGGLYNNDSVGLERSLIVGNSAPVGQEISISTGSVTANNYNLFGHSGESNTQAFTGFTPGGSDITATSDGSAPTALTSILNTTLQNNGGATETHALLNGSPALDAASSGPATDQRGVSRPQGTDFDIGAFELDPTATPSADLSVAISDSSDPTAVGDSFSYVVTITNNGQVAATSVSASTTLSGASATILSATSSLGSCSISASVVSCSLSTLGNGASASLTITVEPNATGTVTASATVSASQSDPSSGNNSASQNTTINNTIRTDVRKALDWTPSRERFAH